MRFERKEYDNFTLDFKAYFILRDKDRWINT